MNDERNDLPSKSTRVASEDVSEAVADKKFVTRCTRCRTLFRLTGTQLEARAGTVRCGRCMNVFNAYSSLEFERPAAAHVAVIAHEPQEGDEAMAAGTPASAAAPRSAEAEQLEAGAPPAASGVPAQPPIGSERTRTRPSKALLWTSASVVLGLLLVAQIVYAFRSDIAAHYPGAKRALESLCGGLDCSIALPQRPDLLHIEASDVQMIAPDRPSVVQLTATFRSYADYDLAYPALDLVLTNANEHALARRIFLPREYVGANRDPRTGIPPKAEVTVALDLDTGELNASGFRVDLLAAAP